VLCEAKKRLRRHNRRLPLALAAASQRDCDSMR